MKNTFKNKLKPESFPWVVINLDRAKEKYEHFQKNFKDFPIQPTRVSAVDGKKVDISDPSMLTPRTRYDLSRSRYDHRTLATKGALGCYMSHVSLWKKIVDENLPGLVILEDDAKPKTRDTYEKLTRALENAPQDADYLFLMHNKICKHNMLKNEAKHPGWVQLQDIVFGTMAQIVTNKGARTLLKYCFPIEMQVDDFIGVLSRVKKDNGEFKVYAYLPNDLFKDDNTVGSAIQARSIHNFFEQLYCINSPWQLANSSPFKNVLFLILMILFIIFLILLCMILVRYFTRPSSLSSSHSLPKS
jgi:glycosyl transferase family 25